MTLHKHYNIAFWLTLTIAIALVISGFLVPPMGEIDGSVLSAVGLLFLWAALSFAENALREGRRATIKHGQTEIEIGNTDEEG